MQLEQIRTLNFCQLLDREDTFSDGLNAIIGRNGSGKSNLLNALRYTLTGVNGNPGKLEDNVAQLGRADEKSLVESVLVHGSVRLRITRQLRPAGTKAKLEVTDRYTGARIESVSGDAKVIARIESYLGVTADVINEMVIVAQDDIFGFLDLTAGKRLASFQKLFRTEVSADIYAALTKKLNSFPVYVPVTTPEACEAEIKRYQELVTAWEQHAAGLRPLPVVQQERDQAVQIVGNYNAYVSLRDQVEKDNAAEQQLAQQLAAATQHRESLDNQLAAIKTPHDTLAPSVQDARNALANLESWRSNERSRQSFTANLTREQQALQALVQPVPPPDYQPRDVCDAAVLAAQQELDRIKAEMRYRSVQEIDNGLAATMRQLDTLVVPHRPAGYLPTQERYAALGTAKEALEQAQRLIAAAQSGGGSCHFCGGPISAEVLAKTQAALGDLQKAVTQAQEVVTLSNQFDLDVETVDGSRKTLGNSLAQWQQSQTVARQYPAAEAALKAAKDVQARSTFYNVALGNYNEDRREKSEQVTYWQHQLAILPTVAAVQVDEAALQATIREHEARETQMRQFAFPLQQARQQEATLQGQLTEMQRAAATRKQQLHTSVSVSDSEKLQAEQRQTLLDQELETINAAATNLGLARNSLTQWQQQLLSVQRTIAAAATVREKAEYCNRLAELFRDLPKIVAHRNLQRLQATINGVLESFRTDFRVSPDADLTFTALFTDGRRQTADRLSGGQKVVLALAFRLAVNLLFAENVGMLVLDEPTAWLDEQNIRGFEPVLSRLKAFSASRGLQIIMVTHEQKLAPLFDRTIQLA